MKKDKILMILSPILLALLAIFGYLKVFNTQTDSIKFKNEYEGLNNDYYEIKISKDNNIKYSSYKELFEVLKGKTGIIYLGSPKDDNSRFAIETLLNIINDKNIDTKVYYLDITSDRDSYTIEDNKLVYEKDNNGNDIKGTENYFKLIEYLDKFLGEYIIYFDNKEFTTNVKRIPIPSIIFVKNGNILGLEYASTNMEYEDLYSIYEDYISTIYSSTCDTNTVEPC